jgi:hypothetical protein
LPTGFPSRRAWLNVVVRDRSGAIVFESGALERQRPIEGNDNDADPLKYEPHFREIRRAEDVEVLRVDHRRRRWPRHHRAAERHALPQGQPPAAARIRQGERRRDIAVLGDAADDRTSLEAAIRVTYTVEARAEGAPFQVEVALRFSRSGFAGRAIWIGTGRWKRSGLSAFTTRWPASRRSFWRRRARRSGERVSKRRGVRL